MDSKNKETFVTIEIFNSSVNISRLVSLWLYQKDAEIICCMFFFILATSALWLSIKNFLCSIETSRFNSPCNKKIFRNKEKCDFLFIRGCKSIWVWVRDWRGRHIANLNLKVLNTNKIMGNNKIIGTCQHVFTTCYMITI